MRLQTPAGLAALALAAAVAFAACGPQDATAPAANSARKTTASTGGSAAPAAPAAPQPAADDVRRMTIAELNALLDKGTVAVIDVRDQKSFDAARIKGARLVPYSEVSKRVDEFPKDKLIVTYCA